MLARILLFGIVVVMTLTVHAQKTIENQSEGLPSVSPASEIEIGLQEKRSVTFTSSNLPIVVIDTENGAEIVDSPKIPAYMGIIANNNGQINHLTDQHNHYKGKIGIELRGNSTQNFPKKPYNLTTLNEAGEKLNVPLFGWPIENDWVLLASYLDHTFIRNPLASYLSRQLGHWACRCQLVELVLNGEYMGIYIFMEKIKVDKGRLDIASLNPDEITEPDITGGYIWEITGFDSNFGEARKLKYPEYAEAAPLQIDYITQFDNNFRKSMQSTDFTDEELGYRAWIDVPSFVDELLVQEAMRNSDAYGWSGYFHKDKGGKINAGPVWDFDQSAGNSSYPDDGVVEGWLFSHPNTNNTPFFWPKLFTDPLFRYQIKTRWESARKSVFKTETLIMYVDSIAKLLEESQKREFKKWPVLGQYVWRETQGYEKRNTYAKEVDYLKDFLTERWDWMDKVIAKFNTPQTGISTLLSTNEKVLAYPNPAKDDLYFEFNCQDASTGSVLIYNSLGVKVQQITGCDLNEGKNRLRIKLPSNNQPGLYTYKILNGNQVLFSGRFMRID
jgi:hypothetical protein